MRRKTIAILLAVAMVASLCMTGSAMAKAKKQTYKTLKSVSVKFYDKDKKKWVKERTVTFKYNKKGDPTKIIDDRTDDNKTTTVNKFKYKKGKKKSLVSKETIVYKDSDKQKSETTYNITYNKQSLPAKITFRNFYMDDYIDVTMKYKYKKGFVTSKTENITGVTNLERNAIKFKKGLPTKITKTIIYGDDTVCTVPFIATFNKNGLYKKLTDDRYPVIKYNYKYKYKKGLVTKVETNSAEAYDLEPEKFKRIYTFKYTKNKISKKNYACMINTYLNDVLDMFWY